MMRTLVIGLLCLGFLSFSCRHQSVGDMYLKAEVITVADISCGIPLLSFEEDSVNIRTLTGDKSLVYGVTQLPDSFRIQNRKLYVLVKKLEPKNEFACNTLGILYPHLQIIGAKER